MSALNEATQLIIDQIDTVQCAFSVPATQLYTYKAKKGEFSPGDLAVVKTNGKYKIVQVMSVDAIPTIDPSAPYDYQWIVLKLDLTSYNEHVKADRELVTQLARSMPAKPKSI